MGDQEWIVLSVAAQNCYISGCFWGTWLSSKIDTLEVSVVLIVDCVRPVTS